MATQKKTTETATKVSTFSEDGTVKDEEVSATPSHYDFEARAEKVARRIAERQAMLNEPFPQEVERQLKKSGTYLTYIPVSEVITRLNKVLGFDGWSYQIIKCERDALDPDFIVAHVRLDVHPDRDGYSMVTKDGFGGQKIKRTKNGDIVDLGDEFKGAVSDALKKAAQALGVGLYLARTEEALMLDDEPATSMQALPQVEQKQDVSPLYESFISLRKSLDETGVEAIRKFWAEFSGGRPVPKAHEFTDEELEALIGECVRLTFSGPFEGNGQSN